MKKEANVCFLLLRFEKMKPTWYLDRCEHILCAQHCLCKRGISYTFSCQNQTFWEDTPKKLFFWKGTNEQSLFKGVPVVDGEGGGDHFFSSPIVAIQGYIIYTVREWRNPKNSVNIWPKKFQLIVWVYCIYIIPGPNEFKIKLFA